jgi:hypothetical protein
MDKAKTIGIIGAAGSTGAVVVDELFKTTDCTLLAGGRNLEKIQQLVNKYGERVVPKQVDVYHLESLSEFCQNCGIVINCSGPAYKILDRVAKMALKHKCHYVDPATALEPYWQSLNPHQEEIKQHALTFLISTGWVPGLSDLFSIYADTKAAEQFDSINSLEIYVADPSEWSKVGIQDLINYTKKYGSDGLGVFKYGKWIPASFWNLSRIINPPQPLKQQRAFVNFFPELKTFAQQKKYSRFEIYTAVSPLIFITLAYISLFEKTESDRAFHMMRSALEKDRQKNNPYGWLVVIIKGEKDRKKQQLIAKLAQKPGQHYWITGVVPATAARMILSGQISTRGNFCLSEAVEPITFMQELSKVGVEYELVVGN